MFKILKTAHESQLSDNKQAGKILLIDSFKSGEAAKSRLDEILKEKGNTISTEEYWIEEYTQVKNGDGLVDIEGLDYDFVDDFYFGRAIVRKGKNIGIIDEEFKEILARDEYSSIERYEYREIFDEPAAIIHYNEDNYRCYCDLNGNFIIRVGAGLNYGWQKNHLCRIPSDGIFIAYHTDSKWALVRLGPDSYGYDSYTDNYSNFGMYTFYDTEKKRFMLYGGLPGPEGTGEWSDNPYSAYSPFYGDVAIIERDGKHGLINSDEQILVEPKYAYINSFSDGLAAFQTTTKTKYIKDKNGKVQVITVSEGGKWGFVNKAGAEVIPAQYDTVSRFYDGYAAVKIGEKWGFINKKGELVIPLKYDSFEGIYLGGVAIVKEKGKYGLLSANLREDTGTIYSSIEFYSFTGNDRFDEPCFKVYVGDYYEKGYGLMEYDDEFYIIYKEGHFYKKQDI